MGCHFLLQGIYLPDPGMEPTSPALAGEFKLNTEPPWKPIHNNNRQIKKVNKYINLCSSSIYSLRKQQKTLFPTLVLGNILKTGQMWADFWTRSKGDSDFSGRNVNCYNILWKNLKIAISSVQFSHSVMSDSLRPHELQHARPPCPSPTPGVHSNSRPSSQLCHPAISSSVVPFSCPQSLPASESFPMGQLFTWGGQSIGVSALASVLRRSLLPSPVWPLPICLDSWT